MKSICLIAGSAPLYRRATFNMLEQEFRCSFILANGPTQQMDINEFQKVIKIKEQAIGVINLYTYKHLISLSKGYDILILDLSANNIMYYILPIIAKLRGQKTLIWTHGWYGKESRFRAFIKKMHFLLHDAILVYGDYAKKLMIQEGIPENKLFAIHNSLDYSYQLSIRDRLSESAIFKTHFNNNYPVLLFIGRLRKVKKLDQIIEAMAILKERGEYYNLVLIGAGEDEALLRQLVNKYGLEDNVWFYGPCFDEEVNAELVYNSDLCVAPGNVGLTAMHTLMFGCPVLTHDNFPWQMPEFESVKPNQTGAFFKYDDIQSLADSISLWFSNHSSEREKIRRLCYKEIDDQWNPNYQKGIINNALKKWI